jgi:hypothetical protein
MTCEEFLARHSDLLDDELPDAVAVEMQLHMALCERCARYDRVLRRGLALFRQVEPIHPTADPYRAVQERIARSEQTASPRRGPAVATLAAAVMLGFFAWSALDRPDDGHVAAVSGAGTVQRLSQQSPGLWADPVLSGVDLIGPGLPVFEHRPHRITVGGSDRPGAIPVVLPAAMLSRGPYSPLVLQPPDYGQATDPARAFAADAR